MPRSPVERLCALATAAALVPIWLFRYFPTQDGPSHLYNAFVLSHYFDVSSVVTHTYFVLNASRLVSATEIKHYDLHEKREIVSHFWLPNGPAVIGVTAGASCPNNLIEETLIRLFELRGISRQQLELAA